MEAKKAPVEKTASVIETFETLIALKKNSQCKAIKNPTPIKWAKDFAGSFHGFFVIKTYKSMKIPAISILYQTKEASLIVISSPKTAVNPQINTIKWRFR